MKASKPKSRRPTRESNPTVTEKTRVRTAPPVPPGTTKQMRRPPCYQYERVQGILESDEAMRRLLGERKCEVSDRRGVKRTFSPETDQIIEAFGSEGEDVAKASKGRIRSVAQRLLMKRLITAHATRASLQQEAQGNQVTLPTYQLASGAHPGDTTPDAAQAEGAPAKTVVPTPKRVRQTAVSTIKMVNLDQIDLDADTESRPLNEEVVEEYVQVWKNPKAQFPQVIVYYDGSKYYLSDGQHRVMAAKKAGLVEINAEVFLGSRLDALEKSLGSNATHGQRRTTADKAYAVTKALREFKDRSDRAIAVICAVSPTFVGTCRKDLEQPSTVHADSSTQDEPEKRRGRDGKARRAPKKRSKATETARSSAGDQPTQRPEENGSTRDHGDGDESTGKPTDGAEDSSTAPHQSKTDHADFDPKARWHQLRDILEKEYASGPEGFRSILVHNIRGCLEEWDAKGEPPSASGTLSQPDITLGD